MTRDVTERLIQFSELTDEDVVIHRVALNIEQVRMWNPPENPAKSTDSRYARYIREFGRSSWELDAVQPQTLSTLLQDEIRSLIDFDQWDEIAQKEEDMKNELLEFSANYGKNNGKDSHEE